MGGIAGADPNIGLTLVNLSPNTLVVVGGEILGVSGPTFGAEGVVSEKFCKFFKNALTQNAVLTKIYEKVCLRRGSLLHCIFVVVPIYKSLYL